MSKFNAKAVAAFIASQSYVQFETQVRGKVASHFGVTHITAARWVDRVINSGLIKRNVRHAKNSEGRFWRITASERAGQRRSRALDCPAKNERALHDLLTVTGHKNAN